MAALEKIIHAQHLGSLPQKGCSRQICRPFAVCTKTPSRSFIQPFRPTWAGRTVCHRVRGCLDGKNVGFG
jgi:hypothetical protein